MGGDSRQPYMYQPPARYSPWDPYGGFNPKAVSQASLAPPSSQKSKHDGPLINFNRHPDSYLIQAYKGSENPMHPDTAKWVGWAKNLQLTWRFLQIIAIVGMAVCVIAIQGTTNAQSWIVRIPPFVDLVATLYGIAYLLRSAKDLLPKSSAAYHSFATIIDIGLIPFYVFICMLANSNFIESSDTQGRWTTLFSSVQATNDVLQATVLISIVSGSIHALCVIVDLYLVIMYRKIAALPPDLNPLEEKLTRRRAKHKHKNSEIFHLTHDEKRMSELSSTTDASQRFSQASTASPGQSRGLSFINSRADQDGTFSPHTPRSSKVAQQMYQHGNGAASRVDLPRQSNGVIEPEYAHRTSPMPAMPMSPKRSSVVSSLHSHEMDSNYGDHDYNRQSKEEIHSDNWFVVNDSSSTNSDEASLASRRHQHTGSKSSNYVPPSPSKNISPLRMNPPTPPPEPIVPRIATNPMPSTVANMPFQSDEDDDSERTKTMTSAVSAITASSRYSTASEFTTRAPNTANSNESWGNSTNGPKGKYFGDLSSAMRGLRPATQVQAHQHQYQEVAASSPGRTARVDIVSPRPKSMVGSLHYAESEISSWNGSSLSSNGRYSHQLGSISGTVVRKSPREDRQGRIVSRSGVDVDYDEVDLGTRSGGMRGRDVSGKVAEEGRGGAWGAWIRRGG